MNKQYIRADADAQTFSLPVKLVWHTRAGAHSASQRADDSNQF